MPHEDFQYEGMNPSQHIIVADDVEFRKIELYARNLLDRAYLLSRVASGCPSAVATATSLAIRGNELLEIPSWLRSCMNLRYLSIPSSLAASLSLDSLPAEQVTLELTGTGSVRLDGFVHDKIERIIAPNTVVRFSPLVFPSLKHFHAVSDRKRSVLRELKCADVQLFSATITPFSSSHDLSLLLDEKLRYLRLVGGNGSSLDGISRFVSLTDLHLHDLNKLESIGALVRLPLLRDLSVGYCKNIRDIAIISTIETLHRLSFYGCNGLLTASDKELLQAKMCYRSN